MSVVDAGNAPSACTEHLFDSDHVTSIESSNQCAVSSLSRWVRRDCCAYTRRVAWYLGLCEPTMGVVSAGNALSVHTEHLFDTDHGHQT